MAQNGTSSGPGATPSPVLSADQPQTSWHHSVTSSSIAPKAMPNSTFAAVAVANTGCRSRCSSMTGAGCRRRPVDEQRHQHRRRREAAQDLRRGPAPVVGLDQGEGERADRHGEDRRAEDVWPDLVVGQPAGSPPGGARGRPVRCEDPDAEDQRDRDDRHVHQEHPVPAGRHQGAAEDRAECRRGPADRGPRADRAGPPLRRRRRQQQAERGRDEERAAGRLHDRAPTRTQTSGAAAQAAEATAKTTMPVRNAARRPIRSAARPAGTSSAANTIA